MQRLLGGERDRVDDEIELAPFLGDAFKHGFHLTGRADVERHHDRGFELVRQRLDIFLRLVVQIGDGQLRSQRAERLGAAPGDRLVIGDADDETFLAFEQLGFDDRNH